MIIPYHDDNPTHRIPFVTVGIIVLNVLCFAAFAAATHDNLDARRLWTVEFGFVPQRLTNIANGKPVKIDLFPEEPPPQGLANVDDDERIVVLAPTVGGVALTLLTSMFMHADIWHIFFNMLFLWVFGNNIEDRLGHVTFACFYLIGGTVAMLCHWAMAQPPFDLMPVIGASGAVAVMLGAYAVTYPRAHIRVLFLLGCIPLFFRLPALVVLGFWVVNDLLRLFLLQQGVVTNVAVWAHIGGFFTGALVMPLLAAGTPEPDEDWAHEAQREFDFEKVDPLQRLEERRRKYDSGITWDE